MRSRAVRTSSATADPRPRPRICRTRTTRSRAAAPQTESPETAACSGAAWERAGCRADRRRSSAAARQSLREGGWPRPRWRETVRRAERWGPRGGESLALARHAEHHRRSRRGRCPAGQQPRRQRRRQPAGGGARRQAPPGGERGTSAAGQARHRSHGTGHPSRSCGRAAQAAPVPGRRPQGGADRGRLHRAAWATPPGDRRCARCSPRRRSRPTPRPSRGRRSRSSTRTPSAWR